MGTIDIIIAILLLIGVIAGLKEGFVKQIAALVGLVAGLLVGKMLYLTVAEQIQPFLHMSEKTVQVIAFVLILIVVPLIFSLLAWLIGRVLKSVGLGILDRVLGACVGILKYALLAGVIITGIELFDTSEFIVKKEKKEASIFYYPLYKTTDLFFKEAKAKIQDWTEQQAEEEESECDDKEVIL